MAELTVEKALEKYLLENGWEKMTSSSFTYRPKENKLIQVASLLLTIEYVVINAFGTHTFRIYSDPELLEIIDDITERGKSD